MSTLKQQLGSALGALLEGESLTDTESLTESRTESRTESLTVGCPRVSDAKHASIIRDFVQSPQLRRQEDRRPLHAQVRVRALQLRGVSHCTSLNLAKSRCISGSGSMVSKAHSSRVNARSPHRKKRP